jgi:hypothetical protein
MNALPALPSACVYAVKLLAVAANESPRIAGRLEHVLSGRRHDFDDGASLLACLALEQALACRAADESASATPK